VGDYEGRGRTLEVFGADAREQRELLRVLRPSRAALEAAAGGPIIVLFHTRPETTRLYSEVRQASRLQGVVITRPGTLVAVRVRDSRIEVSGPLIRALEKLAA